MLKKTFTPAQLTVIKRLAAQTKPAPPRPKPKNDDNE